MTKLISQKIRLILADPPNLSTTDNPYATAFPNLGILYLAAYLMKNVDYVDIYYIDSRYSISEHLMKVNEFKPHLYGISISSSFSRISYHMIDKVKQKSPELTVICGGPHPTADPENVLSNSETDICCIGEAEETLLEIIQLLRNGQPLTSIHGTVVKQNKDNYIVNPRRKYINDLNVLGIPAWDLVNNLNSFPGCRKSKGKFSTAIVASRGCPFNCIFCSNPVWRRKLHECYFRSPESIVSEVLLLYKKGIREIYIRSDEMNLNVEWAISLFNALADLNLSDLHFQCNLRADKISDEMVEAMKRANCWLCHIGLESGSDRVLKGIKKGITINNIRKGTGILKKYNIKVYAFAMLYQVWEKSNKLHFEKTHEVFKTMLFIISMRLKGMIHFCSWGFATPYPGSELFEISKKYNLVNNRSPDKKILTPHEITMNIPGISPWVMRMMRGVGIILQASLFIFSSSSYNFNSLVSNLRHAIFKVKSIFSFT
jgi:anaerobic magnesium-protoporphyrin IX monomethyl ester cyclase